MPRSSKPPAAGSPDDGAESYSKRKARAANRDRAESAAGKEIGELPAVKNPRRRKNCERNLLKYLMTYCRESFPLDFSNDQLDFIEAIQDAVLNGGARAQAMPRGSGKTTIIINACNWAIAYGHRRFIVLIGSEQDAADELCDDVRVIWETNDLLAEDFPEIAAPIRALEGVVNRAKAQTCNGRQTFMRWSGAKLVFPSIWVPQKDVRARKGAKPNESGNVPTAASAAVVRGRGLLGRLRGMKATTPTGETIRPDLVLVEDFQTDASAKSDPQCATRERTIAGAVLGLAGPGKRIAAFATCTVIRLGDAADRILNPKLFPKWRGRRCKLVNTWPTDPAAIKHWAKYHEIRAGELDTGDDEHPKATAYYKKNRKAMDTGADVPWAARKFPHELSAHEHAQNLRYDNPDTFDAEYQNTPKDSIQAAGELILFNSDSHVLNINNLSRLQLPEDTQWVTVGIDVQQAILFWAVLAIDEHFGGAVVDYGTYPEQPTGYTRADEVEITLQQATGTADVGNSIRRGLDALVKQLAEKSYTRADGVTMPIDRGLVDAGFQTQAVYKWARSTNSPYMAAMGFGVGAKQRPWDTIKRARGERMGYGWRMPPVAKTSGTRRVDIDTNTWKTAILPRFAFPDDESGKFKLFKRSPTAHRMIGDHLAAEFPVKTSGRGRELFEWQKRPNSENHLLDAVLYAGVAGNMAGAKLPEETSTRRSAPPKSVGSTEDKKTRRRSRITKTATGGPRVEDQRESRQRLSMKEMRSRARSKCVRS